MCTQYDFVTMVINKRSKYTFYCLDITQLNKQIRAFD